MWLLPLILEKQISFLCVMVLLRGALLSAVSKQRLSNWVVEVITVAYKKAQKPLPGSVSCHSTRSVLTSRAAFRGVSMADICAAATWTSPCTLAQFYKLNITTLHTVSSVVLYIYIYAFSRRFYPKRLTVHSGYTFVLSACVFPVNRTHNLCTANAML